MSLYRENRTNMDTWFVKMLMKHDPYTISKIIEDNDELTERFQKLRREGLHLYDKKLVRDIRQQSFRNSYRKENCEYPNGDEMINGYDGLKEQIESMEDKLHNYEEDVMDGYREPCYDTEEDYLENIDELKIMISFIRNDWMNSSKYLGLFNEYVEISDESEMN